MEVLGSAATIVQLISFTGQVLVLGYGYLSKVRSAPSEIRLLLRETANLNALLDQLQDLVEQGNDISKSALETLAKLGVFADCEGLMKVVEKGIKACDQVEGEAVRNLGKKIVWPFKEKETKDTLAQLGRLREVLSAAVVVDSAKTLRNLEVIAKSIDHNVVDTLEGVAQIKLTAKAAASDIGYVKAVLDTAVVEDERIAIRKWLHPDGIDSQASFAAALEMKHPETGKWLFNSKAYSSWKESDCDCIWIYGIAGCGKTVLSASVIDYLQRETSSKLSTTVYFFCDHRDPNKQSFQNLLHVVVKQLLDQDHSCFSDAKYWRKERIDGQNSVPKPLTIPEYCKFIQQLCSRWDSVSLIVDALDECLGLDLFVGGLTDLIAASNIKLAVTSRQNVELKRVLDPFAKHQISLVDHMREDIHSYLVAEVKSRKAMGKLKLRQENLDSWIVVALEEKADGMILIAKLQLDYVCRLKSDRAIKDALIALPSGVYETYDEILYQLCSNSPEEADDIKRILQWLVCSMVPLTLRELAEAVSIQPDDRVLDQSGIATDVMDLAASCGGLVTIRTQDTSESTYEDLRGPRITLITLAHASVEEYLTSGKIGLGLAEKFHMEPKVVHHELAKTCLQYVGFENFKEPMSYDPLDNLRRVDVERAIKVNRRRLIKRTSEYALVDYASRYWADHLRLSSFISSLDEETRILLNWFVHSENHEGQYESWQQMYHRDVVWYCPGRPPLFYAIEFKIDILVSLLLLEKDEIDALICDQTALHVAARCGAINTVRELLRRGASLELKSGPESKIMTPLHFAAEGGHVDVIALLLKLGASPHSRSESKSTPLYRAARSGSLRALKILYDAGSDINAKTWDSFTPLFEAIAHGRRFVASQLLQWGADPTIRTDMGDSAINLIAATRNTALYFEELKAGQKFATEEDILNEIREIREIQEHDESGSGFQDYLKDLEPEYILLRELKYDTRPGTEREKDYRWSLDPTMIVSAVEYRDRL